MTRQRWRRGDGDDIEIYRTTIEWYVLCAVAGAVFDDGAVWIGANAEADKDKKMCEKLRMISPYHCHDEVRWDEIYARGESKRAFMYQNQMKN